MRALARRLALASVLLPAIFAAHADNTAQTLPFSQDWTSAGLITTADDWSAVPGIVGYRGDNVTASTGVDPQTLLGEGTIVVDVVAQATATNTSGGVLEIEAAGTIAMQGSGTADAPSLVINLDTTGQSTITVSYVLRDLDASTDDAVQAFALQYRIGDTGDFVNVPAGFVADATTASAATLVTSVSAQLPAAAEDQALVQVRIITSNAAGNDELVGIDDIAITAGGSGPVVPKLTISDTGAAEGDGGSKTLLFTASLSAPAGAGGVSFDYMAQDLTATTADGDYVDVSGTATIAEGQTSVTLGVDINGDTADEGDETFVLDTTNLVGATAVGGKGSGTGTIYNDDMPLTPIHDVQGNGAMSPLVGSTVTVRGIVTGRKSTGFFLQAPDAEVDADPLTSEGVFVYTGAAPPASAAAGNLVLVTAAIAEYVPSADPGQLPLTELTSPAVLQLSTGHPLPTAVALGPTFPDPTGALGQLEPLEGMRVTGSFTVAAPTEGSISEANATGSGNGILYAVVTGTARPFREPGIQAPDPAPAGSSIPPIPRWDFNPELLTIDSDSLGGAAYALNLATGAVIDGLTGPLDYGFRRYTVHRDPAVAISVTDGPGVQPARAPAPDEFMVVGYNIFHFYDTANDPAIGEAVLSAAAFDNRLNKASITVRDYLHAPEILALMEMEDLATLQALATRINADAVAAGQPDPQYVAYLEEGNDVGGIDVGFLVKTGEVGPGVPRVEVLAVTQHGKDTVWIQPDGTPDTLNDRPPLALDAVVHYADGRAFPVTVIGTHQRSLIDIDSEETSGPGTKGDRVRRKRQAQAEYLANLIQAMQTADPDKHIVVLGDFNAFEFNDGYVDVMGVVAGMPAPDAETAVPGDGIDLVNPDLINLAPLEDDGEHYSFVFDGNAQSLDQLLINERMGADLGSFDLDHARINADFPEAARSEVDSPIRTSDHDPTVGYFLVAGADLGVSAGAAPASVTAGEALGFDAMVSNAGPNVARYPGVGFSFDAELPDLAVTAPAGWTCDAPTVATGTTTVACAADALVVDGSAAFHLAATAPVAEAGGAVTMAAVVSGDSFDPVGENDSAQAAASVVAAVADLAVELGAPVTPFRAGKVGVFPLTLRNFGPSAATATQATLHGNVPAAHVALNAPTGWTCSIADEASGFVAQCAKADAFAAGAIQVFGYRITAPSRGTDRLVLEASVQSAVTDPAAANNAASLTTPIVGGSRIMMWSSQPPSN